jgi:hypothetical protein
MVSLWPSTSAWCVTSTGPWSWLLCSRMCAAPPHATVVRTWRCKPWTMERNQACPPGSALCTALPSPAHPAAHLHPRGRVLALRQAELHLQHGVGEAGDLAAVDGQRGVTVPAASQRAGGAVIGVLLDHDQVGVQGHAHSGVKGDLGRQGRWGEGGQVEQALA